MPKVKEAQVAASAERSCWRTGSTANTRQVASLEGYTVHITFRQRGDPSPGNISAQAVGADLILNGSTPQVPVYAAELQEGERTTPPTRYKRDDPQGAR